MLLTCFILTGLIFLFIPQGATSKLQLGFARMFSLPLSMGRSISLSAYSGQPSSEVVSRSEYNMLRNHLANNIFESVLDNAAIIIPFIAVLIGIPLGTAEREARLIVIASTSKSPESAAIG